MYSIIGRIEESEYQNACRFIISYFSNNYKLTIDSRECNDNSIFCAYKGLVSDGRSYINNAINNGTKVILWDTIGEFTFNYPVDNLGVPNLAQYIGLLASIQFKNNNITIPIVGVTGTNGKTSITYWINQVYQSIIRNSKTGIIGTTGYGIYPTIKNIDHTTPDPITLQKIINEFIYDNVNLIAMEVSSHSLVQGRVNGINFKVAIFTNLTQDHLDYHLTMENYYNAKKELFFWKDLLFAIINVDDSYGERLYNDCKNRVKVLTYGIESGEIRASDIKIDIEGTSFKINYKNDSIFLQVKLYGKFNIYNILAVFATFIALDFEIFLIKKAVENIKAVIGRLQPVHVKDKKNIPLVFIDYAHTPDALENVLITLKEIDNNGKIICIFGCGGDRDHKKRPIMGNIAVTYSDFVIITTDNPRNEEPEQIISEITKDIVKTNYEVIINRNEAIYKGISLANNKDIILIAGKGHEQYQEIRGKKIPFSDYEIAFNCLLQQ